MGTVHTNVKSQNTEFGQNVPNTLGVTPINVFQNQNRSQSKRVLNKTDVQDLAEEIAPNKFQIRTAILKKNSRFLHANRWFYFSVLVRKKQQEVDFPPLTYNGEVEKLT